MINKLVHHTKKFFFKRYIGWFLMGLGFFFFSPPFSGIPDDFLNIILADKILVPILNIDFWVALFMTYTLLPLFLIYLGAWIYPHGTWQRCLH